MTCGRGFTSRRRLIRPGGFWGLYVHVCKLDTLFEAYLMARKNNGAPGIDGVTFEAIEESGVQEFLEKIHGELVSETYRPAPNRKKEIPKGGGKVRTLGIPCIRDRVVQGASSSSWNPSLKRISKRGRLDTVLSGKPKTLQEESVELHTAGRHRLLT